VPSVGQTNEWCKKNPNLDRAAVWNAFAGAGREKIAATNGLSIEENDELFHTPVIDRAIELVLTGLSRRKPNLTGQGVN
jgi:hypothetical protein